MDSGHIPALNAKHAGLEQKLKDEAMRPLPDPVLVATLKKQKLAIKQEIHNLSH